LGSGKLGVRLAAHSQLILLRVRLVSAGGWVGAAASRRVLTSSIYNKKRTVFNKRVRPHSACALLKTTSDSACAEPLPINA